MPYARQSWEAGNQFEAVTNFEVDFEVDSFFIPVGSTLTRTWIDVRFNQFGQGIEPPEFLNQTGPFIWGVCYVDPTKENPGVNADDDAVDWLWREMVVWGPSIPNPNAITGDSQWMRVAAPPPGQRDSKGQRTIQEFPAFIHFALNLPHINGDPPNGLHYEIFVHTLWLIH